MFTGIVAQEDTLNRYKLPSIYMLSKHMYIDEYTYTEKKPTRNNLDIEVGRQAGKQADRHTHTNTLKRTTTFICS